MTDLKNLAQEFNIACPNDINRDDYILLIENQQDMRLIVAHHLNKLGYRKVHQASNGREALDFLETDHEKVAVTLCDITMPIMGGIELLQELRDNPKYRRGPFILSMSDPSKEKIMHGMENGVDEILVKPYTLKDIVPKLLKGFKLFHNPKNPEKVYELAKSLLREGKLDESQKVYQRIADIAQNSARPVVGLARIAFKRGDTAQAINLLSQAEKRNPNFVHIYAFRGEISVAGGDYAQAVEQFKKAIAMSPLNPVRYEAAAKILFDQHKYQEAVDLLAIAVGHDLQFPELHHFLSQGYFALKDYKKALRHIRAALAHDSQNVTYLNQLGIAYKESEQLDEAMKTYNAIIKLDPDNKAALYNKAVLLHSKGSVDEALKLLERVATKHPDFQAAKNKLAEYRKERDTPKAAG